MERQCDDLVSALQPQVDGFKIGIIELKRARLLMDVEREQTLFSNMHRGSGARQIDYKVRRLGLTTLRQTFELSAL